MQTKLIIPCLMFLAACVGCVQDSEPIQNSHEPEVLILKRENVKLRRSKEQTERENIILKDKVASLTKRDKQLSEKIGKQKFELDQLRRQVEMLADLPEQRDRYKKQAEQLKADVIRLELELRKCRGKSLDETPVEKAGEKES